MKDRHCYRSGFMANCPLHVTENWHYSLSSALYPDTTEALTSQPSPYHSGSNDRNMKPESIVTSSVKVKCLGVAVAVTFLAVLQYLVFGVVMKYWAPNKDSPDRETCDCKCWDTIFKGSYVRNIGGYYLHFYFNVTPQSLKIWTFTVFMIIVVYEAISYILTLAIRRKIRITVLLIVLSSIYSHYYTWWVTVGYWNDDFYDYWNHQILFSSTELIATAVIMPMLDSTRKTDENLFLVMWTISTFHIVMAGLDQFVENVLQRKGANHQQARDMAFMINDIVSFAASSAFVFFIRRNATGPSNIRYKLGICSVVVSIFVVVTKLL